MPVFTETKTPYELLVRWRDGIISGAHVGFITTLRRDGVLIMETPENVQPVAIGSTAGFPLSDILSQVQIDAIIAMEAARAEKAAEVAALKAEIAALRIPPAQ